MLLERHSYAMNQMFQASCMQMTALSHSWRWGRLQSWRRSFCPECSALGSYA